MNALRGMLLALWVSLAGAEAPQDFAFGIPLATMGGEALVELELPPAVYEGIVRADLGDLRVFNAQGEPVPFAWVPVPPAAREQRQGLRLPYFALRGEVAAGVDAIAVTVEQVGSKALLTMNAGAKPGRNAALLGYVIDASSVNQSIHALTVELAPTVSDLVTRLRVDASDDLAHWTTLVADAPLVRLLAGEHRLEQLKVEFPARKARYFRVSWLSQQSVAVTGLMLEPGDTLIEASRRWKKVSASALAAREKTSNDYVADLGGQFPVDRLRLLLPQLNTVAAVAIQSRAGPADAWRSAAGITAFRFRVGGEELISQDIALPPTPHRYWLLRVDQRGGGLGDGPVDILAGWLPQRLVFAARGAAPYQLAYGSRSAPSAAYPIATLVPGYRAEDTNWSSTIRVGRATLGTPVTLAGEKALQEVIDWRRWSLWASLLLGVAVLAGMALRLARQVSRPTEGGPSLPAEDS